MSAQSDIAGPWRRATRAFEFGRHIPVRKLARRVELTVRRHLRDRIAFNASRSLPDIKDIELSEFPPLPLFDPRTDIVREDGDKLSFRFLGHSENIPVDALFQDSRSSEVPDLLWRMNLHYMEYLEEVSKSLFEKLIDQWISASPQTQAGTWRDSWNSYTLSLRTVVWMQQFASRRVGVATDFVQRMQSSLAEQLLFLESNLETDLGGNHLIKNIKALIWGSAFFTGAHANRWRKIALGHLKSELQSQILADGVHYERSPAYHCQVFADLLECRHALGSDPLDGLIDGKLELMAQATADLTHPDCKIALFNDSGLHMAYVPDECLGVYEVLFGERPSARKVFALDAAGYYGLRINDFYFVADCGQLAPDDLPAHGHGDILSFELSAGERRIFVDQGVYEYVAGHKRQQARSAASHNTLSIAGTDQADFFGAFRYGRRPKVTVRHWESGADRFILEGSHNGFSNISGQPVHVRRFEVSPGRVVIHDRVEGGFNGSATIKFLLHPDFSIDINGNTAQLKCDTTRLTLESSAAMRSEQALWWPDMGHEMATNRLVVSLPAGSELETTILLSDIDRENYMPSPVKDIAANTALHQHKTVQ